MKNKSLSYKLGEKIVDGVIIELGEKSIEGCVEGGKNIVKAGNYIKRKPLSITYPILGNLSGLVQKRISKIIKNKKDGSERYDLNYAIRCSAITNIFLYGGLILNYCDINMHDRIGFAALVADLGGIEGCIRYMRSTFSNEELYRAQGSIAGKIVSLPLELMLGIYDRTKEKKK